MNQSELASFKKRNASDDEDKKGAENLTETVAKKLKSENFNLNPAQYSTNTYSSTSTALTDVLAEFDKVHEDLDKRGPNARPAGCTDTSEYNTNRSKAVNYSFQNIDVSREALVTADSFSGISGNYTETSIRNFPEQDSCERMSSSNSNAKETNSRMTSNSTISTVSKPASEFNREHSDISTITTVTKEVSPSHQESDTQRDDDAVCDNTLIRSTTGSIEDSVQELLEDFRRLRICEPQNTKTEENLQYYFVAYSSEEGIQKCIITKKWRPENRKIVGKKWDLHTGTVYLFFTIYGTKQLYAVATLSPDQGHDSYIGVNFLRVICLPTDRYTDDAALNCTPREIKTLCPEWGRTALETFLEYEAEQEDKSVVDDINESLIVRFGQVC